jgi:hypothetical protein
MNISDKSVSEAMRTDDSGLDFFEAVYYSGPVPNTLEALTALSFVFDRIHFPGVYIPPKGTIDVEETRRERLRLMQLGRNDIGLGHLIGALWTAENIEYLSDFCSFGGRSGFENVDPDAHSVALALEDTIFGPPQEGTIRAKQGNSVKGLPGQDEVRAYVSLPFWSDYCANALIYSAKNQIPLLADDPRIPVLGFPKSPKNDTKLLSAILTIECVKLTLPKLKPLEPQELRDFRGETANHLKPFRLAMLRMSKELNAAISSDMKMSEVQAAAKSLVESSVYPELQELNKIVQDPSRPWYKRVANVAAMGPEICANFSSLPKAKLLEPSRI